MNDGTLGALIALVCFVAFMAWAAKVSYRQKKIVVDKPENPLFDSPEVVGIPIDPDRHRVVFSVSGADNDLVSAQAHNVLNVLEQGGIWATIDAIQTTNETTFYVFVQKEDFESAHELIQEREA